MQINVSLLGSKVGWACVLRASTSEPGSLCFALCLGPSGNLEIRSFSITSRPRCTKPRICSASELLSGSNTMEKAKNFPLQPCF